MQLNGRSANLPDDVGNRRDRTHHAQRRRQAHRRQARQDKHYNQPDRRPI